jgi:hypothetical protein
MTARVRLVDVADEAGRSSTTLLASLAARLGTLWVVPGSAAVGSLAAGFAALGREVATTAEGARLRRALESGRPGLNGDAIWQALRIADWLAASPPAPVLEQLRNDAALLLADDVVETLELLPIPPEMTGARGAEDTPDPAFVDLVLGLWAFSRELVQVVEALAEPTLEPAGTWAGGPGPEPDTPLLR